MEPNSSGCEIVRLPAPTCHYIEMHTPILSGWMTGPVITLIHTHTSKRRRSWWTERWETKRREQSLQSEWIIKIMTCASARSGTSIYEHSYIGAPLRTYIAHNALNGSSDSLPIFLSSCTHLICNITVQAGTKCMTMNTAIVESCLPHMSKYIMNELDICQRVCSLSSQVGYSLELLVVRHWKCDNGAF